MAPTQATLPHPRAALKFVEPACVTGTFVNVSHGWERIGREVSSQVIVVGGGEVVLGSPSMQVSPAVPRGGPTAGQRTWQQSGEVCATEKEGRERGSRRQAE